MKLIAGTLIALSLSPAQPGPAQPDRPKPSPAPVMVPPPAPPGPPIPGTPAHERQRAAEAARLRSECLSEQGIRMILDHHDRSQAAARTSSGEGRLIADELAQAALTAPIDLERLDRALRAQADYHAAQGARSRGEEIALLRRLSPEDRVIYARRMTAMRTATPARICPSGPPRE